MDQQQATYLCVNLSLYSKPTISLPDTLPSHDLLIQHGMIAPKKLTSSSDRWQQQTAYYSFVISPQKHPYHFK
jgi:hypothetical protein